MNTGIGLSIRLGTVLALGIGCSAVSEYSVPSTPHALGADLAIRIERTDDGNFLVNLAAASLSPPERIGFDKTSFVVWFKAAHQPAQQMGLLDYDSTTRRGTLAATTTNREFLVLITAEPGPDVTVPGETSVFEQLVIAPD